MRLFELVHGWLSRLSLVAVWIGGAALLLAAVMVSVDVLCRKFLGVTMSGSDEISGYVFAASTTWAYAYCLINRSNVRIDAAYNFMPVWLRAILDVIGLALLLGFMAYLTDKAIDVFVTSWDRNSVSITTLATPQWIPQLAWVTGLVLFCFTAAFVLLYALVALMRGDVARVQRIAGAMNVEEEIATETHGLDVAKRSRDEDA
jgi:TRAP-type C4-dicarboxylate transport system permease small subunit